MKIPNKITTDLIHALLMYIWIFIVTAGRAIRDKEDTKQLVKFKSSTEDFLRIFK